MKIAIIILCIALSGCAPNYKYDKVDKMLLTTAIIAQVADGVTTSQALDRGAVELNPLVGEDPSDLQIIAIKTFAIGVLIWGGSKLKPTPRKWAFGFATLLGVGAAINNNNTNN